MKTYRRILVTLPTDGRAETLLHRATEQLAGGRAQLLVLQVLDTRSGIEPDGPAANLPREHMARRLPAAKQRLDLLLARHDLAWAEARIVCGEPNTIIGQCVRDWRPDLVVACASLWSRDYSLPSDRDSPDVLSVKCHGLFSRLGEALGHAAQGHA